MGDDVPEILAIQKVLADYCLYLDDNDFESWATLFVPDAQVHAFGQIWDGRDEIVSRVSRAVHGLHMAGLPSIAVDGDRATSRQNFQFLAADGHVLRIGMYHDELVRVDGSWRIATRRIVFMKDEGAAG